MPHKALNGLKGLIRLLRALYKAFKGLIRPQEGLIRPWLPSFFLGFPGFSDSLLRVRK